MSLLGIVSRIDVTLSEYQTSVEISWTAVHQVVDLIDVLLFSLPLLRRLINSLENTNSDQTSNSQDFVTGTSETGASTSLSRASIIYPNAYWE